MTFNEIERKLIAKAETLAETQPESYINGYKAGVTDALQEFKDTGITDFDLTKWDFSDLDAIEPIDSAEFNRLIEELNDIKFDDMDFSWSELDK